MTLPPEVDLVLKSESAMGDGGTRWCWFLSVSIPSNDSVTFGLTNDGPLGVPTTFIEQTITIEFDVVTPTNFTGMTSGAKVDTVYKFEFAPQSNMTDFNVPVAKVQNRRVSAISFSSPDSILGDTTSAGGRFYKMDFPSGLPDPSHSALSGLLGCDTGSVGTRWGPL